MSTLTPDYLSTNRYLKHVKRHISTSVPCATFDHLSPLRQPRQWRRLWWDHGLIIAILFSPAHLFQTYLACSLFRIPLHALWPKSLALIISRLFCLICTGLPVRHKINFKIAAITRTVLQTQQPSYLAALIPRYAPVRSLRSSSSLSICVPLRKTSMAASRSFSSVAPKIWNALPGHFSSIPTLPAFRRALKHHFFLSAYPDSRSSGGVTPSVRITLRDTTPPAAIVLLENTMPSS